MLQPPLVLMIKIKTQRVPAAELSLYAMNTLHTSVLTPGDLVGTKNTELCLRRHYVSQEVVAGV